MLFLNALLVGLGVTLGAEIALGLCIAIKYVKKGLKK
jgi:uncharacterized protein YneF (UPF0154 family)